MSPRVVIDRRPPLDPANGAHQHVERGRPGQGQQNEKEKEAVRRAPDRQLRHINTQVAAGERLVYAIGDTLPGQGDISPPAGGAHPDHHAEEHARHNHHRQQRPWCEGLPKLEVRHVSSHLDGADGSIDQQQMSDEPGGRHQASAQVEGETQNVPIEDE